MPSTNASSAEPLDFGLATDRQAHLDDITVDIVTIHETHSLKDALAGLPNGQCHCARAEPATGLVGRLSVAP